MQSAHSIIHYRVTCTSGRRVVWLLLVAGLLNCCAAAVSAQEYLTLPMDEKAKTYRVTAQQCLRNLAAFQQDKDKFDAFFTGYYFPLMTLTDPDKIGDIGKLRSDFFKNYVLKATEPQVQAELTTLAYKSMVQIVGAQNPPCHPAARYNAVLILGQLDEDYAPAKPYLKANTALTQIVDSATTINRFPPAVILGALIGLERHAQLRASLPPEVIAKMQAPLIKLINHEQPIQDMDRDAYAWLRLRAASALARVGVVGEKNANHDAIIKLASNAKSIDDRCAALSLLEKINYKDVKLDDATTAESIFATVRDIAAAEDKRAQEFQDKGLTGGFNAIPTAVGSEYGGATTPTYDPNAFPRRITLSRLSDVKSGLTAVKQGLTAESQKKLDAVLAAMNPVITAAGGKEADLQLVQSIRNMATAINKAIPGKVKPQDDKAKENDALST